MNQPQNPPPLEVEETLSILDSSQLPNDSYIDQWRNFYEDQFNPVYPWSLVSKSRNRPFPDQGKDNTEQQVNGFIGGGADQPERLIPASRLQRIVEIGEGMRKSTGDTYTLDCVLQSLKRHTTPGSQ